MRIAAHVTDKENSAAEFLYGTKSIISRAVDVVSSRSYAAALGTREKVDFAENSPAAKNTTAPSWQARSSRARKTKKRAEGAGRVAQKRVERAPEYNVNPDVNAFFCFRANEVELSWLLPP